MEKNKGSVKIASDGKEVKANLALAVSEYTSICFILFIPCNWLMPDSVVSALITQCSMPFLKWIEDDRHCVRKK